MALTTLLPGVAALVATLVVALGTATWPISSTQLWAHSPGQLAAALAILGLATDRMMLTGAAFAAGILIRPPIAVFPAFTGLGSLLDKSRFGRRAFLIIGITAALSLIALLFYNYAIFGAADVSGGYSSAFTERLITMGWDEYLPNLAAMFVGPMNGLFFWSPVMLVATAGIFEEHSAAPRWSKVVALAGLAYLFLHARLNRASGGLPFNYRYPLEPIVVALPLLAVAAYRWTERGGWRRIAVISSAILSIILQALYTFTLSCMPHTASEVICSLGL